MKGSKKIKTAAVAAGSVIAIGVAGAPYASGTALSGPASPPGAAMWSGASHGELLGQSNINTGDVVAFWQGFLASYGALSCPGGIDGHFGPGTASATRAVQGMIGVGQDGVVGSATFGAAGGWLVWSSATSSFDVWRPNGASRAAVAYAHVTPSGAWKWTSPVVSDGGWHSSDNPGISFTNDGSC